MCGCCRSLSPECRLSLTPISSAIELRLGLHAGIRSSWEVISATLAFRPCDDLAARVECYRTLSPPRRPG